MTIKAKNILVKYHQRLNSILCNCIAKFSDVEVYETLSFREWSKTETMICQMTNLHLLSFNDRDELIEKILYYYEEYLSEYKDLYRGWGDNL